MNARGLVLVALSLAFAANVEAGGFYVPEIGSRAPGLGAAVVADGADPSAIFHNPASLAHAAGLQLELATDLFFPRITFYRRPLTDPNTGQNLHFDGVDNTNALIAAPYLGASMPIADRVVAGFAVYAPFGATLQFPDDGSQRQIVTSLSLRTIYASPAIAIALPSGFSVGVSGNLIFSDLILEQRNALPYITGDPEQYPDPGAGLEGTTRLDGRDPFSVGASFGVGWTTPDHAIQVGASMMTPVTLDLEGDAHVENPGISALVDANFNQLQPAGVRDDQVRMSIPLPLIARLGAAWRFDPRWQVELDINWQRWSTFKQLDVDFVNEHELVPTPGAYLYDVRVDNHWKDTWCARLGAEATPFTQPVTLRAGVFVDQSPIDDRYFSLITPDSDKLGVTAGMRWSHPFASGRFDIDLAAMHVFLRERDVEPTVDGDPGSMGTILNKPAPSFFHGITRGRFDMLALAVAWRQ